MKVIVQQIEAAFVGINQRYLGRIPLMFITPYAFLICLLQ